MNEESKELFELNLLFNKAKSPIKAFDELKDIFKAISDIDRLYLNSIDSSLKIEYSLQDIGYGSIKTKIAQIIRDVPDEAIKEFEWKKLVGHFLLKVKYLLLKWLENTGEVASKDQITDIVKQLEKIKTYQLNVNGKLLTEVNHYFFISILEPVILIASNLKDGESIQYHSVYGSASINKNVSINKPKILWEIGDREFESETLSILKIKKVDMLSKDGPWSFQLGSKPIIARITHLEWLQKFHNREFTLLPEDALKVTLKTTFLNSKDGKHNKVTYEITKVIDIIQPSKLESEDLFLTTY
jgi:hypothetical protein